MGAVNPSASFDTIGTYHKVDNQKDVLTLGIGSKGIISDASKLYQTQFIFFNTEDKNNIPGHSIFSSSDFISTHRVVNGSLSQVFPSHDYAWKFGIVNYSDNDIELDIASYKKDLTDTLDRIIKETAGKADGDALIEFKPDYDTKQILPSTRDIVTGNSFKYNGLNINITSNSNDPAIINKPYNALIEFTNKDSSSFETYISRTKLPHDFIIDFGIFVDNIEQISFCPLMVEADNKIGSCSVKNYQIFCSDNGIDYKLIKEDVFDSNINNLSLLYIFEPAYITFEPISTRFIKLRILSIYDDYKILDTFRSGFANFRIYTNTKNLYNKEVDQSISNYKDNSFNQVTTKPEWDQKSKEDKIILNKQASFDDPSISKIKNELNNFRIITNHNNIPIYEKT